MNYLLDTHALIWFLNGDKKLSADARKAIESDDASNFVSIVSVWEIAIKISLDRLDLKAPFSKIGEEIADNNFQILPITFQDTLILSSLPFHHRYPFDRLLIAQAMNNNFRIITKDDYFENYKIILLW